MEERRCAGCGEAFRPRPQVPDQEYCGKKECRGVRRRRWQRAKRQDDADYRDNQARAQRAWAGENSAYWRAYRSGHPEYAQAERERAKQRQRDCRRGAAGGDRSQRWTRQSRFRQFRQGLTFWCRRMRKSSQRWTRKCWKLTCFQRHNIAVRMFAKRGLDRPA